MSRTTARLCLLVAGSAGTVVLLTAPALAHVTVQGPGAAQGGYSKITFRVPTEEDVPTTALQVTLPPDTPLASLTVQPHPGWTWRTTTAAPATPLSNDDGPVDAVVTSITWTATDGGIRPGEFDEFSVSAGPLPATSSMTFKALQTYANGDVVRWIETAAPGGAEPEHPAPVLQLAPVAATGTSGTGGPGRAPATTPTVAATPGRQPAATSDRSLSVGALAVAVVAAVLAGVGLLRSRRTGRP